MYNEYIKQDICGKLCIIIRKDIVYLYLGQLNDKDKDFLFISDIEIVQDTMYVKLLQ